MLLSFTRRPPEAALAGQNLCCGALLVETTGSSWVPGISRGTVVNWEAVTISGAVTGTGTRVGVGQGEFVNRGGPNTTRGAGAGRVA
jgi:hypothetical protein